MTICSSCGTHTGTHWPDCPFGPNPHYSARQVQEKEAELVKARARIKELEDEMEFRNAWRV